ncbi:L-lactate permease [Escherichia coli]|nr:L-lactate permease [Escherichia coli]
MPDYHHRRWHWAHTGHAFTFFSPFLGWFGVFLTGSDTSYLTPCSPPCKPLQHNKLAFLTCCWLPPTPPVVSSQA